MTTTSVPLIPRELLFGYPDYSMAQLSPDGRYLTYLAPDDRKVLQVWLRTLGQNDDRVLTRDPKRGIRMYQWTHMPEKLVYLQDADGDENHHLYLVEVVSGLVRDLTPFQGVRAELTALHHEHPNEALAAMNIQDRRRMDVYRVNLTTGAVELDTQNPGTVGEWTTHDLHVRAAVAGADDGGSDLLLRQRDDEPWKIIRHWGPEDIGYTAGFSKDGKTLYLRATHDGDTLRVIAYDVQNGRETLIAEDPEYDADHPMTHPTEKTIQAVSFYRHRVTWRFFDHAVAADHERLTKVDEGDLYVAGRNLADTLWLMVYVKNRGMPHYYLYDRPTKKVTFLFAGKAELDKLPLSEKEPIAVTARDGLTLHGYVTLPPDVDRTQAAARGGMPTVLSVHGGPWGRDGWGFWSGVQWLANRGYAVLQVNFRGSTGYGKKFLNAGNRRWAAEMHDDLIDAVNWAIDQGIADPRRIAIMGASYGGYATLVGLTFTPEVFCCGVDMVGPSNLITLLKTTPPWWHSMRAMLDYRVGNPEKDVEFLKSRSPVHRADRIKRPLLIGQGANDPRVKQDESDQIVEAMRKKNLPVQYVVYMDEGHEIVRPANRMHFHALAEAFLAEHLGGRCEPMGDIPGHSGVVM